MSNNNLVTLHDINPKNILKQAIVSGNMHRPISQLKQYWPETDRFLMEISRLLLNTVPDELSGVPLLNTCLCNGVRCTADMLKKAPSCPDSLCIIDHFITHTLDPIPRLLCWKFVCDRSNSQWDPLVESMEDWQKKHPFYSIVMQDQFFTAEEAEIFRRRIREHLIDQSIEAMIQKGNCTGECQQHDIEGEGPGK